MDKKKTVEELQEQNEFLKSLLSSFEDIKNGRVKKFKCSN